MASWSVSATRDARSMRHWSSRARSPATPHSASTRRCDFCAGLQHALAVEVHLRPVLVELGAIMPARGLYVLESQLDKLDAVVEAWLTEAGPRLRAAVS